MTPQTRLALYRRLGDSWRDLADQFGIQPWEQARFARGDEPRMTVQWLEQRARSDELVAALQAIGRDDLAELVLNEQPPAGRDPEAGTPGRRSHIENVRGIQIGEHNTQTNYFD